MDERATAEAVLDRLVRARLLTTFEEREPSGAAVRRVEVGHESLLETWPRLVGWRTQDADAARLRDELREAARTWHEHGRPADLLWTGTTYGEFATWRERYPGRLSESERAFADAVTRQATRRKRRRRAVVSGTLAVLLGLLAVIGLLWQRSRIEARRAEAANLLTLGGLQLDEHPSAAVAYAIASLRLADSPEVRRLALEALWKGPTELRLPASSWYSLEFSPDGRWLATADPDHGAALWPADGGPPTVLEGSRSPYEIRFSQAGDLVAANTNGARREVKIWSLPGGELVRSLHFDAPGTTLYHVFSRDGRRLITATATLGPESTEQVVRSWPVAGGEPEVIARLVTDPSANYVFQDLHPAGTFFSWSDGRDVRIAPYDGSKVDTASARSLEHERAVAVHVFDPSGRRMATLDAADTIRIWSLDAELPEVTRTFDVEQGTYFVGLLFDHAGSRLAGPSGMIWDLTAPPAAGPLRLRRPGPFRFGLTFGPNDEVLATSVDSSVSLWPLTRPYPVALAGHEGSASPRAFTPDGNRLVSTSRDGTVRVWPLAADDGEQCRILDRVESAFKTASSVEVAPNGVFVVVGYAMGQIKVLPLDGSPGRQIHPFIDNVDAIAVDPSSRFVAVGSGGFFPEDRSVRVWDLATDDVRVLDAGYGVRIGHLAFTDGGDLWVWSAPVLRRWDLSGEEPRIAEEIDLSLRGVEAAELCDLDADRGRALLRQGDRIWLQDLDTDDAWEVGGREGPGEWCSLDPTGTIAVLGDVPGMIRVGRIGGGPAHWLPGRVGGDIVVSPDGRWVASGGEDDTIWLWPMPDLDSPPIHTLPRDQLMAKLDELTNVRAVRDDDSPTGWKLVVGPFPGWETLPTW
jgi:WD40 repeat protein